MFARSKVLIPDRFKSRLNAVVSDIVMDVPEAEEIVLFGSCARGTLNALSDIDLLVITKHEVARDVRGDIRSHADEKVNGVRADVVFYTREQFETGTSLLVRNIKNEGVQVWEKRTAMKH